LWRCHRECVHCDVCVRDVHNIEYTCRCRAGVVPSAAQLLSATPAPIPARGSLKILNPMYQSSLQASKCECRLGCLRHHRHRRRHRTVTISFSPASRSSHPHPAAPAHFRLLLHCLPQVFPHPHTYSLRFVSPPPLLYPSACISRLCLRCCVDGRVARQRGRRTLESSRTARVTVPGRSCSSCSARRPQ
jgi:hypothetical protein